VGAGRGDRAQRRAAQRRPALRQGSRRELAGYKQPKDIRFVAFAELPRSTTGKIQRHEVEAWLRREDDGAEASSQREPAQSDR
jgi:acyl-coenzyme A synthetase/AMP-(fatty) acid ligase